MIICDKPNCKGKAEYILNIDYMGQKNMHRIDLCSDHYLEIEAHIRNSEDNLVLTLAEQLHAKLAKPAPKKANKQVG